MHLMTKQGSLENGFKSRLTSRVYSDSVRVKIKIIFFIQIRYPQVTTIQSFAFSSAEIVTKCKLFPLEILDLFLHEDLKVTVTLKYSKFSTDLDLPNTKNSRIFLGMFLILTLRLRNKNPPLLDNWGLSISEFRSRSLEDSKIYQNRDLSPHRNKSKRLPVVRKIPVKAFSESGEKFTRDLNTGRGKETI